LDYLEDVLATLLPEDLPHLSERDEIVKIKKKWMDDKENFELIAANLIEFCWKDGEDVMVKLL